MGSRSENTLERTYTFPCPNMRSVYVVLAFASVVSAQFKCPKPDGTFEDGRQCDKYYECFDGIAEERLCPDGLVFDPFSNKREPCDHYFNVDCGDRLELQPPRGPNDLCPRLNGFYAHPDPSVCNIFYACVEGTSRNTPAHLAFGSMSSEVSATGLLRPRGLAALKPIKFRKMASNAPNSRLNRTPLACPIHIPNTPIPLTVPNSTYA